MACFLECDNSFCCHQYDGYCHADEEEYWECEDQYCTGDKEDEDYEDYAFSDYDCEAGLFEE